MAVVTFPQAPRTQRGMTLIEVMVALVIVIGVVAVAADWMLRDAQRARNENTAEWLRIVASGARAYRNANKDTLIAGAGPSTPVTITAAQVSPFLPNGFSLTNAHGQTFEVRFIEPTAGQLDGMVLTRGGDNLDGLDLIYIAGAARGGGGFIDPANTAIAKGPNGNWSRSLTPFGAGGSAGKLAYALFYDDAMTLGGNDGAFLSREAVAGQPELNRMQTAIDMAGNNIAAAGQINASRVVLPAGDSMIVGSTAYYGDGANSAIRQSGGLYIQLPGGAGAAPIQQVSNIAASGVISTTSNVSANGSAWFGGDVQSNRSFVNEAYAAGWFRTQGDSGWYSERWGGGWHMTDSTWIRAYGGKNVYTPGEMRANRMSTEARMTAGEFVQVNGWAGRGGWCDTNGLIGREGDGTLLFCKNNAWVAAGGATSGYYTYLGEFYGTYVGYNTSSFTSYVTFHAQAQPCGSYNGYNTVIYVNGQWIGNNTDNVRDYAKVGHTSFPVPAGGSFQITPQWTGTCNTRIQVWQYTQT